MIGLREDQQMKARIVDYLNNATALCGSWLACDSDWSVKDAATDTPSSQASLLPHWREVNIKPVAASPASKAAG